MEEIRYLQFVNDFGSRLYRVNLKNKYSNYIFLCIGTDKIVGDSFGPIVGYTLGNIINNKEENIIYGTMGKPINYINIKQTLEAINKKYENPCIITIDAALTKDNNIGDILVNWGGIEVGKGLNKNMYCYSDINIKGIVGKNTLNTRKNIKILKNIKYNLIYQLSSIVSNGIKEVLEYI